MSTVGVSAAARVIKKRLQARKLPTVEVPQVESHELARSLQSIQEHFRMYEGDSGAPKERFVTMSELENAGLIKSDVKSGFAYISQVVGQDVAQQAGSTSNPTQTDPVKKDTSRTGRIPGGGGGGARAPSKQAAVSSEAKLGANVDVKVQKPAQDEFLFYDGGKWTNFPIFNRPNRWRKQQIFDKPMQMLAATAGPAGLDNYGFFWAKDDAVTTPYFTQSDGTAQALHYNGIVGATFGSPMTLSDTAPKFIWYETDVAVDEKLWDMVAEASQMRFRARADDDGDGANIFTVDRTGFVVDNLTLYTDLIFGSTNPGTLQENTTSTYSPLMVTGSKGGYGGISLDGYFTWMNSGAAHVGLYDDVNNSWMILAYPAGRVQLYYSSSVKLATTSTGVDVTGDLTATGTLVGADLDIAGVEITSANNLDTLTDGVYKWASSDPTNALNSYGMLWQMSDPNQDIQLTWGGVDAETYLAVRRADSGTFYDWKKALLEDNGDHTVNINDKEAFDGVDTWLRLNQNNEFTSGVYTPYGMRIDGTLTLNGNIVGDGVNTMTAWESITLDSTGHLYFGDTTSYVMQNDNIRLGTDHGYVDIGPLNASYCHFNTNISGGFYFYDKLTMANDIVPSGDSVRDLGTSSLYWALAYIDDLKIQSTGDITKTSHGNYLYHKSTAYDNDQNGQITFGTGVAAGGTTGDIHFQYT